MRFPEPRPCLPVMGRDFDRLILRIVGRPQGVYWLAEDGRSESGPFPSLQMALADLAHAHREATAGH